MRCSSCGTELDSGARFCSSCGTPQSSGEEERRVVTVLFGDIVGFTSLAETLDPEDVKHLIDRCFERLAGDIVSFGGVVDKILGDGIVALFGAPIAHEDDAERAVRAGLRMQQTMISLSAEAESPMQMRIGVNTGEVLVGMSSAGGDYTAMGDVMNIAARLEQLAEPGRVLVGASTHAATDEAISYRPLGLVETKGREAEVEAWVALSAIRPPGARRRRTSTFAGRERELELIEAQARLGVELRQAQATMILGESGMGKTRVAEEAANAAASKWNARVLEGRAVPYGEANVWWPFAEVVRQAFGLQADTELDEARALILGGLSIHLDPALSSEIPRFTTALLHVLGFETSLRGGDRDQNRAEVTLAITNLLEAELTNRPVVIVMSDVHWAADAVWVLIRHLLDELRRFPLMLILTAKGVDLPSPLHGAHGSLVIQLGPLDVDASLALLDELDVELSDAEARQLVDRSGGNPFFLEELAGLVRSRQQLGGGVGLGELPANGLSGLPDTLRGIIAARLDALEPRDRTVLEAAAVLGRSGSIKGLSTMVNQTAGIADVGPSLNALVSRDLIATDGMRYEFRSEMVRDVAYGTLTKATRARSHHGIATYLEASYGESPRNSVVVAIADHYRATAQLLAEVSSVPEIDSSRTIDRALHWLHEAGQRALDAGAPLDADRWFSDGLELCSTEADRARFLFGRARARSEVRDIAGARADLDRLVPIAAHDRVLAARSSLVRGDLDRKAGDLDRAASRLREAADRLKTLDQWSDQAVALRLLGMTEMSRGHSELARHALEESRFVASSASDLRNEAWALQSLGWFAFQTGNVSEAERLVDESESIFTSLDDRGGLAWARGLGAWVAFHVGDWERARKLIDEVLPETQRRGDPWAEGLMLNLSASLELWSGNAAGAAELSQRAIALADSIDDLRLSLQSKALHGRALVSLGRISDGTELLDQTFLAADRGRDREARRFAVVSITASAARLGESERAIRWAARFDGDHRDPDVLGESDLAVSLSLAMLQRGAVAEAASQLAWIESESESLDMYAQAAGAIVAAAQHDELVVARRSHAVMSGPSTYLDRILALLARAAMANQRGETTVVDECLADARGLLAPTDDRVTPLIVDLVAGVCGRSSLEHAEIRLRGLGVDPSGWRRAWELAASAESLSDQPN